MATLKDYRRFWVDHRYVPLAGTFKFDIEPVSIRILDPQRLSHSEKIRQFNKEFWAVSSSILVPIDLTQYEACDCWPGGPGRLVQMASLLSSLAQCGGQKSDPLTFITIFMNKEGLRAKLDRVPFSSIYPDYEGRDDSPEDVIQYMLDRICIALDTSNDKERMPIDCCHHVGEEWEESTLKYILEALKNSQIMKDLVAWGLLKKGQK